MGLKAGTRGSTAASATTAARKRMVGTEQQEAIWAAMVDGDGHLEVEALAGTGKSTTLREGAWRLKDSGRVSARDIIVASFNKHIADALKADLPGGCQSRTLHSIGYQLLAPLGQVVIDPYKTDAIAEIYFPDRWGDREERAAICRLVSLIKAGAVDDPNDRDELRLLAVSLDVDLGPRADDVLEVVPLVLEESRRRTAVVDYDDMVWLPGELDLRPSRSAEMLMVDEAQDLSPTQHNLVFRVCPQGRIVSVGDRRQAIYAWRGADAASMDTLAGRMEGRGGLSRLPLTRTWRCPRTHVDLARRLVPALEAAPNAIQGEIEDVREQDLISKLRPGDLVLCRNNAPLVPICFALLREGISAVIRGRDVGKGLLGLVERMKAWSLAELAGKLEDHLRDQTEKLLALRHPEAALSALHDRVECAQQLAMHCRTVEELKGRIKSLFDDVDDENAVVLSTIHKAKGLERSRVAIVRPDLIPNTQSRSIGQELNLLYVAITRSKQTLMFVGGRPSPIKTIGEPAHSYAGLTFDPNDMGSLD